MLKSFSLVVLLFLIFGVVDSVIAAQGLDLEIEARLGSLEETPAIYLRTREGTSVGVDTYDQILPSQDKPNLLLRSMIGDVSDRYFVDTWDAEVASSRTLELRFQVLNGVNNSGDLVLSWDSDDLTSSAGRYFFTLKDYSDDSTMSGVPVETDMRQQSSYTAANSFNTRYFEIEATYNYCGDVVVDSWEVCDGTNFSGTSCSSLGFGTGDLSCVSSCQAVDPSSCEGYNLDCGDGRIDSIEDTTIQEECDWTSVLNEIPLFNSGESTCQDWGYSYGSLSCVLPGESSECEFDFSGCFSSDGTPGSSPGGGGSGGSSCVAECLTGQRRCVAGEGYQVCGVFGFDSCARWSGVEKCLGINPICKNGFCFGCLTDEHCKEGFCINGKCETGCGQSCEDLGQQCGRNLICGIMLDCGECGEGLFCGSGICSEFPEGAVKISKLDCSPEFICSPWSECQVSFDSESLLSGESWFVGKKDRTCFDSNECYSTIREEENCLLKVEITTRETEICGIKYIEVYEKGTNNLLARTRDLRYQLSRMIEIFLLPGEIDCQEEGVFFKISLLDRLMFILDFRNFWRLFI